jgi:putative membrane protein insertion efficiency factor
VIARAAALALIGLVRLYQATLAYFFRGACRFEPSCSRYATEALATHGAARGGVMALRRLCRCHPWGGAGYDPVPAPPRPLASTLPRGSRAIDF